MCSITETIQSILFSHKDEGYREFSHKLIPTLSKDKFIGVRMPVIRKIAKDLYTSGEYLEFINELPHKYHEENLIHSSIIPLITDKGQALSITDQFLPYVDNWATCDAISLKMKLHNKDELYGYINKWIKDTHPYTIRFAIKALMDDFLDDYKSEYGRLVILAESEEYYVNMMRAWFFATALSRQYDSIIPILENKLLDKWTHNKAIQKSIESFRITPTQKEYLRSLKH